MLEPYDIVTIVNRPLLELKKKKDVLAATISRLLAVLGMLENGSWNGCVGWRY